MGIAHSKIYRWSGVCERVSRRRDWKKTFSLRSLCGKKIREQDSPETDHRFHNVRESSHQKEVYSFRRGRAFLVSHYNPYQRLHANRYQYQVLYDREDPHTSRESRAEDDAEITESARRCL